MFGLLSTDAECNYPLLWGWTSNLGGVNRRAYPFHTHDCRLGGTPGVAICVAVFGLFFGVDLVFFGGIVALVTVLVCYFYLGALKSFVLSRRRRTIGVDRAATSEDS